MLDVYLHGWHDSTDFGNQLIVQQVHRRSKIPNCARLSALFDAFERIRIRLSPPHPWWTLLEAEQGVVVHRVNLISSNGYEPTLAAAASEWLAEIERASHETWPAHSKAVTHVQESFSKIQIA